jgi:Flp pilus assembly protein TadG
MLSLASIFVIALLILILGVVREVSHLTGTKSELQNAADAIALTLGHELAMGTNDRTCIEIADRLAREHRVEFSLAPRTLQLPLPTPDGRFRFRIVTQRQQVEAISEVELSVAPDLRWQPRLVLLTEKGTTR